MANFLKSKEKTTAVRENARLHKNKYANVNWKKKEANK